MGLVVLCVLLWVADLCRASCGSCEPQGISCPAPPVCDVAGNWTSAAGGVQVLAWRQGGLLGVMHWSRGIMLQGTARLAAAPSRPAFASVLVGSSTTPSLCLQLVLACFRSTLWVTEIPMVGSGPAVSYPLQRHVAPAAPRSATTSPKNTHSPEGSVGIAHNVLVNITLYHNLTSDDVTHDVLGGEAAEDAAVHARASRVTVQDDQRQESVLEDAAPVDEVVDDPPTRTQDVEDDAEEGTQYVTLLEACEDHGPGEDEDEGSGTEPQPPLL